MSRRFRAASRAYPTLNRRRGTGVVVALIVILGAASAVIWKLRPGSSVPPHPVTTSATTIAPATAAEPAPTPPPAPAAEPTPPTPPPPAAAAVAPPAAEKPPAEKPAAEERSSSRRSSRHKSREEAATARAGANEAADKPAEAKPAEAKAPEAKAADEKPAGDKPAAPEASAPAAAEAKPAAAILKITSSPAGADVSIDGSPVGMTPFTSRDIDPGAPHAITLKKDGFETHERMVGASDWSRPHGSTPPSLKVNVKLRRIAPPPGADAPKESGAPAEDTGGPYIKEVNPSNP